MIDSATRLADRELEPVVRRRLSAQLGTLANTRYLWKVSAQGRVSELIVGSAATANEWRDSLFSSIHNVAFPEEPIGLGGRWGVTTSVVISDVRWTRTATFTLTKLDGSTIEVTMDAVAKAPRQRLRVEPRISTTPESGTAAVIGSAAIRLDRLAARSNLTNSVESRFTLVDGPLRLKLSASLSSTVEMQPVE